jgi:cyclophilin family peptidyl-prolyl cis-trans isomerase
MKNTALYIVIGIVAVVGAFLLFSSNGNQNTNNNENEGETMNTDFSTATRAVIETEKGNIELELYANDAPKTVTNFVTLAKQGYYNDLIFHRVEIGIVQTGDPNGNGTGGSSIYGDTFEDELNPETDSYKAGYAEGVLAMANRGPNTNGSQFFINQEDNTQKFSKDYTIFGKVTSGMDIVKNIEVGDKITTISIP